MNDKKVLLEVRDLSVKYKTRLGLVSAVDHVSFDIHEGEILGLVGESGCGKSTMGKALMRMIQPPGKITGGELVFHGEDIMQYDQKQMQDFRGRKVSMIFQDPMTSLNPVQRLDEHIIEAIHVHYPEISKDEALERASVMIEKLGIQSDRMGSYPHQLSGGMRQRVMVALGLILNANLIIADEATTSLDVIVEAKLADQFREIREEFGVTLLVITHNIALVAELSDRLAVMYAGHVVEIGDVYNIFDNPLHPYTKGLLHSVPNIKLDEENELFQMPGEPPNLTHPPSGCRFHPRCPRAMEICSKLEPDLIEIGRGRHVKCWLYEDHPDKTEPTIEVEL